MELLQIIPNWTPIIIFLLTQTVAFIGTCIAVYVKVMSRLREVEIRVTAVEKNEAKIFEKMDELLEAIHRVEIKIARNENN